MTYNESLKHQIICDLVASDEVDEVGKARLMINGKIEKTWDSLVPYRTVKRSAGQIVRHRKPCTFELQVYDGEYSLSNPFSWNTRYFGEVKE